MICHTYTPKSKGRVLAYTCDISKEDEVKACFSEIQKNAGRVEGLVNNAGVNPSRNNITDTTLEDWNQTLDINLTGAFLCTKYALLQMLENKRGSIVNISSIAGLEALPKRASYGPSKTGLIGLTRSAALDYAKKGIRVNCVCPGYVKTDLVSKYLESLGSEKFDVLVKAHPMEKLGKPEDISKAVLFLLSDDARWITGAVLPVDGGYSVGKVY